MSDGPWRFPQSGRRSSQPMFWAPIFPEMGRSAPRIDGAGWRGRLCLNVSTVRTAPRRAALTRGNHRDGRPNHRHARHRADRRFLHDDAARPAQPRPRRRSSTRVRSSAATAFSQRWGVPHATTSVAGRGRASRRRHRRRRPAQPPARGGDRAQPPRRARPCCAPSRSARTAAEAKRILELVEPAGVFGGYLEDLVLHAQDAEGGRRRSQAGAIGDVMWVRSRETHPGPHSAWFWDAEQAGRRLHRRPRLPLHRDHPQLRRQGQPARRGDVLGRHAGAPDRGRGQRHRAWSRSRAARSASSR